MRIFAAIGLALCLTACGGGEQAAPSAPRVVRAQEVHSEGEARLRTFSGVSRSGMETRLSFKVAGTARAVPVKLGDTVRAGDLIAQLDPTDYRLRVEEAEAALRRQQAGERNAQAAYQRTEALYENNNASLSDLDMARAQYETARAAVRSAEKALELARAQLSYCTLTAPADGALSQVVLEPGENVQPGQTVARLNAGERPEVEISVPEALIGGVREGEEARVKVDALPDTVFSARVAEVGVAALGGATAFPVKVRLDQPAPEVLPGMAAEVELRFPGRADGKLFLVPPGAVGEDDQGIFCFVVEDLQDGVGVAHRRAVRSGDLRRGGLETVSYTHLTLPTKRIV